MAIKPNINFFFIFLLLISNNLLLANSSVINAISEPNIKHNQSYPNSKLPFSSGETLHYQLSYRGLLTSMIWADIADAKIKFIANQITPEQHIGHQLILQLTTEKYTKSEIIHPVRYKYIATLDETMQRTILIEKKDSGASDSHEFLWLDWHNKETQHFKKREKEIISFGLAWPEEEEIWEKDGKLNIPVFLDKFPLLDKNHTYLIHKGPGKKITTSKVLEPLSMIYSLRMLDTHSIQETTVAVLDKISTYHIERIGLEEITTHDKKYQAVKYKIQRNKKKNKQFYIWLSNDERKIPLRIAMNAPLGDLEIQLVKISGNVNIATTYREQKGI